MLQQITNLKQLIIFFQPFQNTVTNKNITVNIAYLKHTWINLKTTFKISTSENFYPTFTVKSIFYFIKELTTI